MVKMLGLVFYGDETLRKKVETVKEITPEIKNLVEDMFNKMYVSQGVGLAAPQIGKLLNITVIDPSLGDDPSEKIVLINPRIIESAGEQYEEEGCLSFPGITAYVKRPTKIKVQYENLEGVTVETVAEDNLARIYEHEIDHLNGVLFIDHIKGLEKQLLMRKIKKSMNTEPWNKAS
jgi:peptide deformylase